MLSNIEKLPSVATDKSAGACYGQYKSLVRAFSVICLVYNAAVLVTPFLLNNFKHTDLLMLSSFVSILGFCGAWMVVYDKQLDYSNLTPFVLGVISLLYLLGGGCQFAIYLLTSIF